MQQLITNTPKIPPWGESALEQDTPWYQELFSTYRIEFDDEDIDRKDHIASDQYSNWDQANC